MLPDETAALRRQLLGEFTAEALEHLDVVEPLLVAAEGGRLDDAARAALMRAMHSIKGAAGYMELADVQRLAHALETTAQRLAGDQSDEDATLVELLLAGTAELRELVAGAEAPRPADPELLAVLNAAGQVVAGPAARRERPSLDQIFRDVVRQQCQALRSAVTGDAAGRDAAEAARSTADGGRPALGAAALTVVRRVLGSLRSAAEYAGRDDALALVVPLADHPDALTAVLVEEVAAGLTALVEAAGDGDRGVLADGRDRLSPAAPSPVEGQPPARDPRQPELPARDRPAPRASGESVASLADGDGPRLLRVPQRRVDVLIEQVGELLTARTQLDHFLGTLGDAGCAIGTVRRGRELGAALGRIVEALQGTAMELRLVRLETLFRRLPRICRDAAARTEKQVRLELTGGETELDAGIAELIADPLLHLLRNAVDHGLEGPGERRQAGKPAEGLIAVSARHEAAEVVIEVRDDGRGIDPARVRARAVERGLLDAASAAELSAEGVFDLLFQPGFSTAATVTDLSGRGVGLDVVRSNVGRLGGRVGVRAAEPGTCFELRLPVRLAATDVVLVRAGSETLALALDGVQETLSVPASRCRPVAGRPAIVDRGRVLPLARLAEVLGTADDGARTSPGAGQAVGQRGEIDGDDTLDVVVTEAAGRPLGLVVDEIGRHQQVVAKPLEGYLASPGLTGAAVLGDGRVVLVVSPAALVAAALAT